MTYELRPSSPLRRFTYLMAVAIALLSGGVIALAITAGASSLVVLMGLAVPIIGVWVVVQPAVILLRMDPAYVTVQNRIRRYRMPINSAGAFQLADVAEATDRRVVLRVGERTVVVDVFRYLDLSPEDLSGEVFVANRTLNKLKQNHDHP